MDSLLSANFLDSLGQYFQTLPVLSFIILGFGFLIRGETAILFSVYFIQEGFLSWGIVVPLAFVSIVVGDTGVYMIGKIASNTLLGKKIEKKWPKLLKFQKYLKVNAEKLIFAAKFAAGLTMITMFSAGWSGIKLKRFVKIQVFTATVWMTVMGTLSYFLITGLGYLQAKNIFDKIEYGVLGLVVLFILGEVVLQKYIKRKAQEKSANSKESSLERQKGGSQ